MKLSVLDLVPVMERMDAAAALQQAALLAQTAEQAGYVRYWVAEHHDMEGLACSAPEVLLAHIGARTERIRLGSGALLLPHYKPYKVAELFHMLASLYPGRIDLGLGRAPGGTAHVSMALSGNFLEHVRGLPESLASLMDMLAGRYQLDGVPVTARPVPPVPPEVWMLGTNVKSASYAAAHGTGYVFGQFMSDQDGREVLDSYRRDFRPSALSTEPRVIVAVGAVCADTEEEARQLAAAVQGGSKPEEKVLESDAQKHFNPPYARKLFAGTPDKVKAQLLELGGFYGTDELMIVTMIPDYRKRLRSYELLAGK